MDISNEVMFCAYKTCEVFQVSEAEALNAIETFLAKNKHNNIGDYDNYLSILGVEWVLVYLIGDRYDKCLTSFIDAITNPLFDDKINTKLIAVSLRCFIHSIKVNSPDTTSKLDNYTVLKRRGIYSGYYKKVSKIIKGIAKLTEGMHILDIDKKLSKDFGQGSLLFLRLALKQYNQKKWMRKTGRTVDTISGFEWSPYGHLLFMGLDRLVNDKIKDLVNVDKR